MISSKLWPRATAMYVDLSWNTSIIARIFIFPLQFRHKLFKIPTSNSPMIIIPSSMLDDLKTFPVKAISFRQEMCDRYLGKYTAVASNSDGMVIDHLGQKQLDKKLELHPTSFRRRSRICCNGLSGNKGGLGESQSLWGFDEDDCSDVRPGVCWITTVKEWAMASSMFPIYPNPLPEH